MPKLSNRWSVLALLVFARVCMGLQFGSAAALVPFLVADLEMSYAQAGTLVGLFMGVGVFLALPSGVVSARLGDRATLIGGLGLMVAGALVAASGQGVTPVFAGRVISGVGAVFLNVTATKVTTDWFAGREIASAMSLLGVSWPIGIAITLTTFPYIAQQTSWQAAVALTGAISAVALVAVAALLPGPAAGAAPRVAAGEAQSVEGGAAPGISAAAAGGGQAGRFWAIGRRELILMIVGGFAWPLMNGGFITYLGFAPSLLIARGQSAVAAGLVTSTVTWVGIVAIPLGGYLVDRTGRKTLMFVGGTLAAGLFLGAIPLGGAVVAFSVFYGLAVSMTPGAVMSLPAEALRPASRATGFGVFYTVFYLGMGALPALAGWAVDFAGDPAAAIFVAAFSTALAALPWLGFRWLLRRWGGAG